MPLEEKSQYTDMLGAAYLSDSVDLSHYVPFTVKGDGNCLLHAAVVATNGGGDSGDLRERLASELVENAPFYRLHLKVSDKDWANSIESASLDGHYLGSEHIFALANVLRRPIILLDNKDVTAAYGEGEVRRFPRTCIPIAILHTFHWQCAGPIVCSEAGGLSRRLNSYQSSFLASAHWIMRQYCHSRMPPCQNHPFRTTIQTFDTLQARIGHFLETQLFGTFFLEALFRLQ